MNSINTIRDIKSILGDVYLERFKVFHPDTLFDPNWPALLQERCPLCGNKLKYPRISPKIAYCDGVKHGKRYVIKKDRLNAITAKYGEKV